MTSVDLFLSYSRSDRESVDKVRQILNALAVSTFVDYRDLVPGLPWPQALEQALRGVRCVPFASLLSVAPAPGSTSLA